MRYMIATAVLLVIVINPFFFSGIDACASENSDGASQRQSPPRRIRSQPKFWSGNRLSTEKRIFAAKAVHKWTTPRITENFIMKSWFCRSITLISCSRLPSGGETPK